ncbi:class I SAM-dependent methyltransferase [Streptomyces labedae]|uniref:Methyltransferase domain-containing protein n=1 Tax=Streptomyces labedae TaxID=285569 RepID=A0ABP6QSW5_9ACTN
MGRIRNFFDRLHRGLFDALSLVPPEQQGRMLRLCFESKHRRPDPWHHAVTPYETFKYATTLACVPPRPYRRIADIGCSEGTFTCRVAQVHPAAEVVGVDISERALTRARTRAAESRARITFEALDILTQSPGGTFDLVFCAELLYYLGRKGSVQLVCDRVTALLEPGGLLILVHPWPESRRLYGPFDTNPLLARHCENVVTDSHRPFAVTLYERCE